MCRVYNRGDPFDRDEYFEYLIDLVGGNSIQRCNYICLLRWLYDHEFTWILPTDKNRAEDGLLMRMEYADMNELYFDSSAWPCSILEMMIALAKRCEHDIIGEPGDEHADRWFWLMLNNLGLLICNDSYFMRDYVEQIVMRWMKRSFTRSGQGSMFPLHDPARDQRKCDIWSQMNEYLIENYSIAG